MEWKLTIQQRVNEWSQEPNSNDLGDRRMRKKAVSDEMTENKSTYG